MLFFVNPNAGHTEIRAHLLEVLEIFTKGGFDVTVHPTSRAGELTEVIAAEGGRYDMVTAAGGDGTLNEAVSGLMQLEAPPCLGYIPGGTVNDVAATLHLPKNCLKAAEVITGGREIRIDLGRFNRRWFAYVAAFGAFTDVAYSTDQSDKRLLGRLAYLLRGVQALGEIRPVHIRASTDAGTVEEDVILGLVASTTSVGGFQARLSSEVYLNDGLFEVLLVKNLKNVLEVNAAATAILRRDFSKPFFYRMKTDRITFDFDGPVPWTLDGEFGGAVRQAEIRNCRKALRIMAPAAEDLPMEQ